MKKLLFPIMCFFLIVPQFLRAEDLRVKQIMTASEEIRALAYQEVPSKLSLQEKELLSQQAESLLECSRRLSSLASSLENPRLVRADPTFAEIEIAEIEKALNLRYLELQKKMQGNNRQYTMISNVMKTKHDTAKSAINNIR